jgi:hypothetical protein
MMSFLENFSDGKRKVIIVWHSNELAVLKSDPKRMLLLNDCYKTVSGHFFAISMFISHKSEIQRVSLRCLTDLNHNLLKSYYTKSKYFLFRFFAIL